MIRKVLRRLEALEKERVQGQPTAWRKQVGATEEDDREPAVMIGGWNDHTDSDRTLAAVRDFIRDNALPLPAAEAFVPGQQRGFAVVPLTPLGSETRQAMMRRAIEAVESTRKLRVPSGHKDKEGKAMVIWAAVSQPPEVRRKAELMAKSKRAVLESYEKMQGPGTAENLQVKADYRRCVLTVDGKKLGGCAQQPVAGEILACDHGWVDARMACEYTKEKTQDFAERWHKLVDAIS